jgi:hypothetical protein
VADGTHPQKAQKNTVLTAAAGMAASENRLAGVLTSPPTPLQCLERGEKRRMMVYFMATTREGGKDGKQKTRGAEKIGLANENIAVTTSRFCETSPDGNVVSLICQHHKPELDFDKSHMCTHLFRF